MLTLAVAAAAYVAAAYLFRRWFDSMGITRGMTRGLLLVACALAVAGGAAALIAWAQR